MEREELLRLLMDGQQLHAGQVAIAIGVSRRTVWTMVKDGRLRAALDPGGRKRHVVMASVIRHLADVLGEDLTGYVTPSPSQCH